MERQTSVARERMTESSRGGDDRRGVSKAS